MASPLSARGRGAGLSGRIREKSTGNTGTGSSGRLYYVIPAGAVNGTNTVYSTPDVFVYAPGSEADAPAVYLNGIRQRLGPTCDYTLSESSPGDGYDTITFNTPPRDGDNVAVDYNPVTP